MPLLLGWRSAAACAKVDTMCGRFTSLLSPKYLAAIRELFGITPPTGEEVPPPRYNVAPTQMVLVLRQEGDHNRLDLMRWGLLPPWAKDPKIGNQMINARCETVAKRPAFRQAIKHRRCIIPVGGFFEWLRHEVACVIVRQSHLTGPAVPSAVPYEVWRQGNESSKSPRTM